MRIVRDSLGIFILFGLMSLESFSLPRYLATLQSKTFKCEQPHLAKLPRNSSREQTNEDRNIYTHCSRIPTIRK